MSYVICVKCSRRMYALKNGISVIEYFDMSRTDPYRIWYADLFQCDTCGARGTGGFSPKPYAEQFHEKFAEILAKAKADEFTVEFS